MEIGRRVLPFWNWFQGKPEVESHGAFFCGFRILKFGFLLLAGAPLWNKPRGPLTGNRKEWFIGVIPSFPAEHQQVLSTKPEAPVGQWVVYQPELVKIQFKPTPKSKEGYPPYH